MAKQMKSNVSVDVNISAKDVNTRSVSENSPELYDVPKPQASAGLDYDIPKPHHPEIKEEVYDQPRLNRTPERLSLDKIQQHDDAATLTRESERISQKPKTIDSPKPKTTDSPFEADGTKTIKKFPLLSKSRAITEENSIMGIPGDDDKNPGTKFAKTLVEIDDKTNLKSQKSPERRPKPPRNKEFTPIGIYENTRAAEIQKQSLEKSPTVKVSSSDQQHYGVRNVMSGEFDVYAKPAGSNINVSKSFRLQPPELPPRNTPQSSPRSSVVHFATNTDKSVNSNEVGIMNMDSMSCARCDDGFEPKAKIVNSNGELYHPECFVCAQCFRPFPDGVFYEFEGRKYCEHDFHVLFAPCCGKCGEFIIGRVIKAMMATWHPQCFTCEMCHKELADLGFIKNQGRALCHECNAKVKAEGVGKYMCQKCHSVIDGEPLRFRGEVYHPYHYNCAACGSELTSTAREVRTRPGYTANELNELYCLRCHDKMGIPICGACRRPIEERVVTALGKHWHVEHFVCAKCEKPFLGNRHYERKGLAYCETHYHQLFGNLCYVCNQVIQGDVFTALNKAWCVNHFACSSCDQKMTVKTKFYEVDLKPVCKKCYDRYPRELRLRLKRYHENEAARDQGTPIAASK